MHLLHLYVRELAMPICFRLQVETARYIMRAVIANQTIWLRFKFRCFKSATFLQFVRVSLSAADQIHLKSNKASLWPSEVRRTIDVFSCAQAIGRVLTGGMPCYGIVVLPSKVVLHPRSSRSPHTLTWHLPSVDTPSGTRLDARSTGWLSEFFDAAAGATRLELHEVAIGLRMDVAEFGATLCGSAAAEPLAAH